ncbi:MAG: DUF1697 domain-containing protein [Burkholderiaceae bacterium]
MTVWIALIRGINVGGKRIVPMNRLVALLEKQGARDVVSYIQSGNLIFRDKATDDVKLGARIAKGIDEEFGFSPKVMVLTANRLEQAVRGVPTFEASSKSSTVHLFFLAAQPSRIEASAFDAIRAARESWQLGERVFYLFTPDGAGQSKLAQQCERILGVDATARNLRTATELLTRAQALESEPSRRLD